MQKITIPKPCHQNWDNMYPEQNGRHCSSCAKTVIDFTQMTDVQVQNFLIDKQTEQVCGRFSTTQIERIHIELPKNIFQIYLPTWKQFLVASLLIFSTTLFSCDANTQGEPLVDKLVGTISIDTSLRNRTTDTMQIKKQIIAEPVTGKRTKCISKKKEVFRNTVPETVVGEPAVVHVPDSIPKTMGMVALPTRDTLKPKPPSPVIMGKMIRVTNPKTTKL